MENMAPENRLKHAIVAVLGLDDLGRLDARLAEGNPPLIEVGIDSLALVELGIVLEDDFGIVINPSDFELKVSSTYEDLLEFVLSQIPNSS